MCSGVRGRGQSPLKGCRGQTLAFMMQLNACSHTCVSTYRGTFIKQKGTDLGVLMLLTVEVCGCEEPNPRAEHWLPLPIAQRERDRFLLHSWSAPVTWQFLPRGCIQYGSLTALQGLGMQREMTRTEGETKRGQGLWGAGRGGAHNAGEGFCV